MKRITALILVCALLATTFAGCGRTGNDSKSENIVSRGAWIRMLAEAFGMDSFTEETPHLKDVSPEDELFSYVQASYEWNVFPEATERLKADAPATVGFVAETAVNALGQDYSEYSGNLEEIKFRFAEDNGIIPRNLKQTDLAGEALCAAVLEAAGVVYRNIRGEKKEHIIYEDNVYNDVNKGSVKRDSSGRLRYEAYEPEIGDLIVLNSGDEDIVYEVEGVEGEAGEYEFSVKEAENVKTSNCIDLRGQADLPDSNGILRYKEKAPEEGDIFIIESADGSDTEAVRITAVKADGTGLVLTADEAEMEEIFQEIEVTEPYAVPDYDSFEPAEGVSVRVVGAAENEDNMFFAAGQLPRMNLLSATQPFGYGFSKGPSIIGNESSGKGRSPKLEFDVNFSKGKITIGDGYKKLENFYKSGSAEAEGAKDFFEKTGSVFPQNAIGSEAFKNEKAISSYKKGLISSVEFEASMEKNSGEEKNDKEDTVSKFTAGYEIKGALSLSDIYADVDLKLKKNAIGIPVGMDRMTIETNYKLEGSLSLKGSLEEELKLGTIPIPIGTTGIIQLKIDLILYAELNGELSLKLVLQNNTKTEYKNGNRKTNTSKESTATLEGNISLEAGAAIKPRLTIVGYTIIDIKLSVAFLAEAKASISYGTEWSKTDSAYVIDRKVLLKYGINAYVPIIKISGGTEKHSLANKIGLKFKLTLLGKDKAAKIEILPDQEYTLWQRREELPIHDPTETNVEEIETGPVTEIKTGLSIAPFVLNLYPGETGTVLIKKMPEGYQFTDFIWSSENAGVASVSDGIVTANKPGTTSVLVTSKDGKYEAECAVIVYEAKK